MKKVRAGREVREVVTDACAARDVDPLA